ncbi:MAG TPA: IS256 family transposase [Tepidisphaeraceae bacterium]|jgi:transposase-like protein|nr:IS256 family transposase [Tepidisphaeraceae bacterium]
MSSSAVSLRLATEPVVCVTLEQIAREGARRALQKAIEDEVAEYLDAHRQCLDESGHRQVVRNGHKSTRTILSAVGPIEVKQPRVDDRRVDENGVRFRFISKILPPYLRKTQAIEDLVPWLYLKGISTGEMSDALVHLGFDGTGLSASSVVRMTEIWQQEHEDWSKRSLAGKEYVYLWADGIYFGCRLTDDRPCKPCRNYRNATKDGSKELIAILDGQRESETSWTGLLLDLKSRGLTVAPKLATGDGSLGFWLALAKIFPSTKQQRCWVHKTANVLDKLPKGQQAQAKKNLHEIWMSATKEDATKAFNRFIETYGVKWPRAAECLEKDRAELLAFYDFPAEHWGHLRTSNPIESTFATVRLRTYRTKGPGSRAAALAMAFKLAQKAEKGWRRLNKSGKLQEVIDGVVFVDGIRKAA